MQSDSAEAKRSKARATDKRQRSPELLSTNPDQVVIKRSRGTRSKENTRRKLISAALSVMSEKGVDGTSIADITEAADVGFGSFYNHFSSKNEIAGAVFFQRATELGQITDAITSQEPDKAVAVAYIQKVFLTKAIQDPVWGWFLVRIQFALPQLMAVFEERSNTDLRDGLKQGRFTLKHISTATRVIIAGIMAVTRAMLEGEAKPSAPQETIEAFLTMLGLDRDEARQLSRRQLPRYVLNLIEDARRARTHPVSKAIT